MQPEFEEREGSPPPRILAADPEIRDRLEREELQRRLDRIVRERDAATERLRNLDIAYGKAKRAWALSKDVISERFGPVAANLIRQGIEEQVEREFAGNASE